ncbi:MAG: hypothetical protein IPO23_05100 [Flavobacterium sp.]|nr:hypothetical protein [Flavobacterium sp.]
MKTYYFSLKKISIYSLLGFMAITASSCGSYQNSSYYDRDGIYGDVDKPQNNNQNPQVSQQNNQYKEYFGSLQNNNEGVETFTDVENYRSNYSDTQTKFGIRIFWLGK